LPMADPSNVCKDDVVDLYERHARAYDRDRAARFRNVRGSDLRRFFVATQAVSLGSMVPVSVQFRRTSAGG
jgi:hypothetical protein